VGKDASLPPRDLRITLLQNKPFPRTIYVLLGVVGRWSKGRLARKGEVVSRMRGGGILGISEREGEGSHRAWPRMPSVARIASRAVHFPLPEPPKCR
jgi:hypothetical protein